MAAAKEEEALVKLKPEHLHLQPPPFAVKVEPGLKDEGGKLTVLGGPQTAPVAAAAAGGVGAAAPAAALRACAARGPPAGFVADAAGSAPPPAGPKPFDVSDRYPFATLCQMLEHLLGRRTPQERIVLFERLWNSVKGSAEQRDPPAAADHYPFMRLLLPHLDSERGTYGLKESKIAQYYIQLLGIPKDSHDATRLLRWKDPTKNAAQTSTHFSDVVFTVLRNRGYAPRRDPAAPGSWSVQDVNRALDDLCAADSPDRKRVVLMRMLRALDATEQKWLIRIIVKDMRMHVQHTTLLGRFHPYALDLYNTTSDLRHVCNRCVDPDFLPRDCSGVMLFRPFAPMLASLVSKERLEQLLETEPMTCEPKYDGERMLLHYRRGGRTMFWTRNAKDYSDVYGPKFAQQVERSLRCDNCIVDGELLVWDERRRAFKPFGSNKSHALEPPADDASEFFCFMAFDLVFHDGVSLVDLPLDQRRSKLGEVVAQEAHRFEIVPSQRVRSAREVLCALDQAVDSRYEGVVLKNAKGAYVVGERKLKWVKLKRDHIDGLADSMDLAILGGYYGTKFGRRHISHFLLGVRCGPEWHTFCKVGTGYTETELTRLLARLDPHWQPYARDRPPALLGGWQPAIDDVPDMWIDPKDSAVLEIVGFSFTETIKFLVGMTVRFPRVKAIRSDKSCNDAMSLTELRALMEASQRNHRRAADLGDDFALNVRGRAQGRRAAEAAAAPTNFVSQGKRTLPAHLEAPSSALCVGGLPLRLCVFGGDLEWPKELLEDVIRAHGGEAVANPTEDSYALAASAATVRVRSWRHAVEQQQRVVSRCRHHFVLHYRWLLDSVAAGGPVACAPRYMVYVSPALAETFQRTMDRYGDSFVSAATLDTLRPVIEEARRHIAEEAEALRAAGVTAAKQDSAPAAPGGPGRKRKREGAAHGARRRKRGDNGQWAEAMAAAARCATLRRDLGLDGVGLLTDDPGDSSGARPWVFDGCCIWFDEEGARSADAGPAQERPPQQSRNTLALRRIEAALAGAVVATAEDQPGISHVVVDRRMVDRAHHWRQLEQRGHTVVGTSWVDESLRRGVQVAAAPHRASGAAADACAPTGFFAGAEADLRALCQAHEDRAARSGGRDRLLFFAGELGGAAEPPALRRPAEVQPAQAAAAPPGTPPRRKRRRSGGGHATPAAACPPPGSAAPAAAAPRPESVVATLMSAATQRRGRPGAAPLQPPQLPLAGGGGRLIDDDESSLLGALPEAGGGDALRDGGLGSCMGEDLLLM